MAYIKENWDNKEKRSEQAKIHTKEMQEQFNEMIEKSVRNSISYYPGYVCDKNVENIGMEIIIDDIDSVSAILKYRKSLVDGRMAVLNFSSYKDPGGMFLCGSEAQEECLCHESFLYNVLCKKKEFYDWNNMNKNKGLYLNRGLYSPDILFIRNNNDYSKSKTMKFCDVITCAAPNRSVAQRYQNVSDEENIKALTSRIKFVLDIAKDNNVDTLILGAYGCGVFGQDAKDVASIFKGYLNTTHKCFGKVIFAIPKEKQNNFGKFKEVFRC